MGKGRKVVNKMQRRSRNVLRDQRGKPDLRDQREERVYKSQRIFSLLRGWKRRFEDWWGQHMLGHEPALMVDQNFSAVARFDYGVGDWGIKCTFDVDAGVVVGEHVLFLEGDLEGLQLEVVSIAASDFRVEDVATFVSEADVKVRVVMSKQKGSYV